MDNYIRVSATISNDLVYRYDLERVWDTTKPMWCWIMLNPSTADGESDDNTIRRIVNFSKVGGAGALVVVNLFAFRATNPGALFTAVDPVGEGNDEYILYHATNCKKVITAWGDSLPNKTRPLQVATLLRKYEILTYCLGKTKKGNPKHPLYVPSSVYPQEYSYW